MNKRFYDTKQEMNFYLIKSQDVETDLQLIAQIRFAAISADFGRSLLFPSSQKLPE